MSAATKHAPLIDVSDLEYARDKVRCPECRGLKSVLYVTSKGNRCSACVSGRPGKGK